MFERLRRALRGRPALELRVRELRTLLLLTPQAFEAAVADLLTETGYTKVKVSGGPGDLAADITCRDPEGRQVIVQCKQYGAGRTVGSKEIQQFIGMAFTHHKADRGVYVTTAAYTAPAIALARRHEIELIDGDRLAELLLELRGPSEAGEESPVDPAELVARGIYDPTKVDPAYLGARLIGSGPSGPLIVEEIVAVGLPKQCGSCTDEMDWTFEPLGWRCASCGDMEDWETEAELREWPERRTFHEFLAALNSSAYEAAAGAFARGAAVTYLSGPVQALRSRTAAEQWVSAFPLILQPLTAWRGVGAYNLIEMCDAHDRATGFPVGQLTALVSLRGGEIAQLFTNPA